MSAVIAWFQQYGEFVCVGVFLVGLVSGKVYLQREMEVLREEVRRCHESPAPE